MILALILAQSLNGNMNLNVEPMVCLQNGSYVRADRRRAFELNCGTNMTCTQSGGRVTIASSGGAGGGGAPIDGGYLTLTAGSTGSHNEVVLSAGTNINITAGGVVSVTGTVPNATAAVTATALASNPVDCGSNQYASAINSSGDLTCSQVAYSQLTGTPTIPTDISAEPYITKTATANLSNEFALGSLATGLLINTTTTGVPTIKSANTCTNQFPRSDNASGTWTCASIATADLPTVTVAKGGTGQTTITTNQVYVGTALDTLAAKTIPSCSNGTTDKLLFDNSTQTWSCGTDQGGGTGLTSAEVSFYVLQGAF